MQCRSPVSQKKIILIFLFHHPPPAKDVKYCNQLVSIVCMSVSLRTYLKFNTSKLQRIFCVCYLHVCPCRMLRTSCFMMTLCFHIMLKFRRPPETQQRAAKRDEVWCLRLPCSNMDTDDLWGFFFRNFLLSSFSTFVSLFISRHGLFTEEGRPLFLAPHIYLFFNWLRLGYCPLHCFRHDNTSEAIWRT